MGFVPYAVSWNLTSRCNLSCSHCYLDAGGREKGESGELTTEQVYQTIDRLAELNKDSVLILTGGEPMARSDLYGIIRYASAKGLMVVLGTNGTLLNTETASKLKEAGLAGVGVSIDSLNHERHDTFRGKPGALKASMAGLLAARDAGLGIQVQTTPTNDNLHEIPLIAQWAHKLGARVFNIFFLVCTGRGEQMADISPGDYEKVLQWAAEERDSFPGMMIRPKCAPHFKRILHQENPDNELLKTYIAACRAGTHYCRITPTGVVTPCPYMESKVGDVTKTPFDEIWSESPEFKIYREPELAGKCGLCRYRLLCGGCRARALATVNDPMGEDQWCVYEPVGQEEAIVNIDTQAKFGVEESIGAKWSEEAEGIMAKIPFFARPMVRLGVEKYARENDIDEITADVLRKAAPSPRMFDNAPTPAPVTEEEIPWDDDARERVKNAPDFVRPGIPKLMQKRAKERGKTRIDNEFLSEIRDESMMLAARRMKRLGFDDLDMKAWDTAREKMGKSPDKQKVIDKITALLGGREEKNESIMKKFGSFFADDTGEKMGWSEEARSRLKKAPVFVRGMAKSAVEKFARENGYKYVTAEAMEKAMEKMPMGNFRKM